MKKDSHWQWCSTAFVTGLAARTSMVRNFSSQGTTTYHLEGKTYRGSDERSGGG